MLQSPVQPPRAGEPLTLLWKASCVATPSAGTPALQGGHFSHPVLTPSSAGLTRRGWADPRATRGTGFRAHECPCPKGPANLTGCHPRLPAVTSTPLKSCSLLSLRVGFIKLPLPSLEVTGTSCGQGSLPAGCTGTRSAQQQLPGLCRVLPGVPVETVHPSVHPLCHHPPPAQAASRGG